MTKISIWTAFIIDWNALTQEALKRNKQFRLGSNDGLEKIFFIEPDLNTAEKTKLNQIFGKLGDVTIT